MRMSARKWSVALAVLTGVSGAAAAQDKFASALNNSAHHAIISMPQIIQSSAIRNGGMSAGLQAVRGPDAIRSVNIIEPSHGVGKSLDAPRLPKLDRVDRLDRIDSADASTKGETSAKSDTFRKDTKIAANTADDSSPSQQPAARANTPPPACR